MKIENGDTIKVDYEGKFDSGEIFDSSSHGDHSHPIEFVVGEHHVVKGFEDAVLGMSEGEEKEFSINPEDAYGESNPELRKDFPRSHVPLKEEPKVGMVLAFNTPDGQQFPAQIVEVTDEKIVFDLNHPLAGKKLNFKIKVVSVEKRLE